MFLQSKSPHSGFSRSRLVAGLAAICVAVTAIAACGSSTGGVQSSAGSTLGTSGGASSVGTVQESTTSSNAEPAVGTASDSSGQTAAPNTPSYPVTVTAANGPVTVTARPTAIVSLSPTATEMLYAVGAGSQVIGVDADSNYPHGLPTTRFDALQLNIEAVAKAKPDLVVSAFLSADQLKQFAALKIPVLLQTAPQNISGTYQQITQLGEATGHADEATVLVTQMKEHIAKIVATAPHITPPGRYYYELDQTFYSVTSDTFVGSLFGLLGLRSIADTAKGAAAAGGYPQLSAEFIVKSNPDYIVLSDTKCCRQSAATVAARPGWSTLSAVKSGRIIVLDDDIASRWGPRVVDLLQNVVAALDAHPVQR